MVIDELKKKFDSIAGTASYSKHQEFIEKLLTSDDLAMVDYHYELLGRRENHLLHQRIRHAFTRRKRVAEQFLAEKLKSEKDPKILSDVLLLLGTMRSDVTAGAARRLIADPDPDVRYTACVVIGWVGEQGDIPLLSRQVHGDSQPLIRGTAAAALRQLWHRLPETKSASLEVLRDAIRRESNEETLRMAIVAAQSIAGRKFGLTERIDERKIVGDVGRAKEKALKALVPPDL